MIRSFAFLQRWMNNARVCSQDEELEAADSRAQRHQKGTERPQPSAKASFKAHAFKGFFLCLMHRRHLFIKSCKIFLVADKHTNDLLEGIMQVVVDTSGLIRRLNGKCAGFLEVWGRFSNAHTNFNLILLHFTDRFKKKIRR